MEILICTDGSSLSVQSAELINKLGLTEVKRIMLLGVSEAKIDVNKINSSMDMINHSLGGMCPIIRKIRYGNPSAEILAEALESPYDLVVVGGGSGQLDLMHPQLGPTTRDLSRKLHTHFLVTRNIPDKIRKILVCVRGDAPSSETMSLGGKWIANTSAEVGVLHVISKKKSTAAHLKRGGDHNIPSNELSITDDPVIEHASRQLHEAGLKNKIIPHIRYGLIVNEVLMELSEGGYELLIVGAHYQPGQDLWQGALFDDITDQLLNRSNCSVLII